MRKSKTWNKECECLVGPIAYNSLKKAFLQLPDQDVKCLLEKYGSLYGEGPKKYALNALNGWRTGRIKLSGQVSYRLIRLVPKYLNTARRIEIFKLIVKYYEDKSEKKTVSFVSFFDEDHRDILIKVVALINQTESRFNDSYLKRNIPAEDVLSWILDSDIVAARELLYLNKLDRIRFLQSKAVESLKQFCESADSMREAHGNFIHLKIDLNDIFVEITFKQRPKQENGLASLLMVLIVIIGLVFIPAFFLKF